MRQLAIVALGSNLGDSRQSILRAMERLQSFSDAPLLRSSLWQTSPVDCPPGSPVFVNAVVALAPQPRETPESLLAKLQALEKEFGRKPKKVLNEPRPLVMERRSGEYLSTSAIGTCARITWPPGFESTPSTLPRRLLRSPMTSPMASSGTAISMDMIGSSRTGLAFATAALNPSDAAILNAISEESTS